MAQIKERYRYWGDGDMMAAVGADKRTDSREAEKRKGFNEYGSGDRIHTDADSL